MLLLRYFIIFCVVFGISSSVQRSNKKEERKGCAKREKGLCKLTGRKKANKGRCKCDLSCIKLQDCCHDFYQSCRVGTTGINRLTTGLPRTTISQESTTISNRLATGLPRTTISYESTTISKKIVDETTMFSEIPSETPLSTVVMVSNALTTRTVPTARKTTTSKHTISSPNSRTTSTSNTLPSPHATELTSSPPTPSNTTRGESATTQPTWVTVQNETNIDEYNSTIKQTIRISNTSAEASDNDTKVTQTPKLSKMTTSYISLRNSSIKAVFRVTTKSSNIDKDMDRNIDTDMDRNINTDVDRNINTNVDTNIDTDTDIDAGAHFNSSSKLSLDDATHPAISTYILSKEFLETTTSLTRLKPMETTKEITKSTDEFYDKAELNKGDNEGLDEKYIIVIGIFSTTAIIALIVSVLCVIAWRKRRRRRRENDQKDVEYKLVNKEKLQIPSDDRFL